MESSYFNFNGVSSEEYGVKLISTESGLYNKPFLATRSIVEKKIPGRNKAYFQRVESEPLSFSMIIYIDEWKNLDNLRQIQRWLYQDYYKPLQFYNGLDKIYYVIFEGDSTLIHNGLEDGYVELNVRCDSSYSYSTFKTIEPIDNRLFVFNEGDVPILPNFEITKLVSSGNISITNKDKNSTLTLKNLQQGEKILLNGENEVVQSSLEYLNVYRYDDHNDEWLSLEIGESILTIQGDCTVKMMFQEKYLS